MRGSCWGRACALRLVVTQGCCVLSLRMVGMVAAKDEKTRKAAEKLQGKFAK